MAFFRRSSTCGVDNWRMPRASERSRSDFDAFVENYDAACSRGLALSGETRDYFAEQRIAHTRRLCSSAAIHRIVDFGCGLGHSTPYFLEAFPGATIAGVDTSAGAIQEAKRRYRTERVDFSTTAPAGPPGCMDLAYSNGTFHHIEPRERPAVLREIFGWLAP